MLEWLKHMLWIYSSDERSLMELLSKIDIFQWYTDCQLYEISQKFYLRNYQVWDIVLDQWIKPQFIWIVHHGSIEVMRKDWTKEKKIWEILPWWIYAEMAYFRNTESMAKLVAKNTLIVWEIDISSFENFLKAYPDQVDKIKEIMYSRDKTNKSII